jgi:hypothetical protein
MVGRRKVNIEPFKNDLVRWFKDGLTFDELSQHLKDIYYVELSGRSIKKRMQKWNIFKRGRSDNSETLRARITYIFYKFGGSDEDIQEMLEKDGFAITIRGVMDIRKSASMYRRTIDLAEDSRRAIELLTVILQGDHPIDDKGKTLLMEAIRKKKLIIARSESHVIDFHQKILIIYKDRLFAVYRFLNLKTVRRRLHNL